MRLLILLCLLAGPAFADPLSDEKTRQVLAEGEVLRAGVRLWDKAVNFRTVEYEIRYKGEFYVCTIGWSEKKPTEDYKFPSWSKTGEGCDG